MIVSSSTTVWSDECFRYQIVTLNDNNNGFFTVPIGWEFHEFLSHKGPYFKEIQVVFIKKGCQREKTKGSIKARNWKVVRKEK